MATVNIQVDDTAWVLASTATDVEVVNKSSYTLRLSFSATPPALGAIEYLELKGGERYRKVAGFPAENLYLLAGEENVTCDVAIS